MKLAALIVTGVVLGGGAVGAATALRSTSPGAPWSHDREDDHPGPDSARVASLFASLQSTDPVVCEMIADQIGNFWMRDHQMIGRFAGAPLNVAAAKDSVSSHVRDPRAINLLVTNLGAQNVCIRRLSSKMLGNSAIDARRVATLLASTDPLVRESAAFAAGHRDSLDLREPLEAALNDRVPAVAAMAAWALGEGDDARVIPALLKASRHSNAHVRATVIWALGNLDDDEHRYRADVVPVVKDAFRSGDAELREVATHAITHLPDASLTRELLELLSHPAVAVRESAVEALSEIGTKEAIAGITRALNDKSPAVRKAAVEALGEAKEQ